MTFGLMPLGALPLGKAIDVFGARPALTGMAAMVFWGLFVHWLLQIVAVWWFALCVLKDDEPLD